METEKQSIILIGGGGHCKACIDVIESTGLYKISGIIDNPERKGNNILGYPIIGTDDDIPFLAKRFKNFVITVGHIKSASIREKLFDTLKQLQLELPIIISPNAYISKRTTIGEGTIVMHHSLINSNAKIGKMGIINSGAIIEHDNIIGDFCHISIGAVLGGDVTLGDHCFIGGNSFIHNNIKIAKNSIISGGSVVTKSFKSSGVIAGNPAQLKKTNA